MIGVVLAGGASARFGGKPKGLQLLGKKPLALHVADILSQVCSSVLIEAPRDVLGYEALDLPLIHARAAHAGKGPLAALAAGLEAAGDDGPVAFAPCDMPLLTPDIFRKLADVAGASGAYANTPFGFEPLVAVLHVTLRQPLFAALEAPSLPRTHVVLDAAGARAIDFATATQFANVNTPSDLARIAELFRD